MNERNYGIDVARILAILLVVAVHVLGAGCAFPVTPFGMLVASVVDALAFAGVNLFALISGYVGVTGRATFRKWLSLYLQVWVTCGFITIVMRMFGFGLTSIDVKHVVEPVFTSAYWYFTAYTGLFVFMPILNAGLLSMDAKMRVKTSFVLVLVFSVLTMFARTDVLNLNQGYSVLWLIALYSLGAVSRLARIDLRRRLYVVLAVLGTGVTAIQIGLCRAYPAIEARLDGYLLFKSYTSPTVLLTAWSLLMLCANIKVEGEKLQRLILYFSGCAFGVYLIHVHPIVFNEVWRGSFTWMSKIDNPVLWAVILVLLVLTIFVLCSIVESLRRFIFALVRRGVYK